MFYSSYRRKTPPRREALRHSGEESRRWTSATVTLYLDVELSSDNRPGTEQNKSPGASPPPKVTISVHGSAEHLPLPVQVMILQVYGLLAHNVFSLINFI